MTCGRWLRAKARLGGLTAEQEAAVEAATRSIVNKVLHVPTSQLRCLGRGASRQELLFAGSLLGIRLTAFTEAT